MNFYGCANYRMCQRILILRIVHGCIAIYLCVLWASVVPSKSCEKAICSGWRWRATQVSPLQYPPLFAHLFILLYFLITLLTLLLW